MKQIIGFCLLLCWIGSSIELVPKLACYFLIDNNQYPVSAIDPQLCTHVLVYGLLRIDYKTLRMVFYNYENNKNILKQLMDLKSQNRDLKIVGAMGCGGGDCPLGKVVVDSRLTNEFVKSSIDSINRYNFDGLDLDWEYPGCPNHKCDSAHEPEKRGFAHLLLELKKGLSPNQTLSAAVHPIEWLSEKAYDFKTLASTLDFVNVMDYDAAGGWDGKTGHHANMAWVQRSMNYWASKVPRSKLLMGVPFYGVKFVLKDPNQHDLNAPIIGESTQMFYSQICKSIKSEGWTTQRTSLGPIAYKGNQWVSYDDPISLAQKAKWVVDNGFGGVMVWEANQDDIRKECSTTDRPMMRAVAKVLFAK